MDRLLAYLRGFLTGPDALVDPGPAQRTMALCGHAVDQPFWLLDPCPGRFPFPDLLDSLFCYSLVRNLVFVLQIAEIYGRLARADIGMI